MIGTRVGTIEPFAVWKEASIRVNLPNYKQSCLCDRDIFYYWDRLPLFEPDPIHVKANCAHNVYLSLHKRYLKTTPEVRRDKIDFSLLNRIINHLAAEIEKNIAPFDGEQFLQNKTGRLKRRYYAAYQQMLRDGVDLAGISKISAFVKTERYFETGKAPRMIMGRDPAFTLLYSQIVQPIEEAFFKLPQVANACDPVECGERFSKLVGEWFIENDMSKFEASQQLFTLAMEYAVYSKLVQDRELLDKLFVTKLHKNGSTGSGVSFKFLFCRGSGDADTSVGNGILNYIASMYFQCVNTCSPSCMLSDCDLPGCHAEDFTLKGDDSYMQYPRGKTDYINTYQYFGFDAKIILRKTPEEVEFCSGHFVEYQAGKYLYVQKLRKLLQSIQSCINLDAIRNGWVGHYYKSLGLMYNVLYSGLPVYEDIGKFLMAVDVPFGLRKELVTSYNLNQLFSNSKDKTKVRQVNRSLAAVSISLVNDLSFAELERLGSFLRTHVVHIPAAQKKRCNAGKVKITVDRLDFDLLNDQVKANRISPGDRKILQQLRNFSKHVRG